MTTITQILQQHPYLVLMETSKHSPPLTTMTKDNPLFQCCTYFDIGFLSLLFLTTPPIIISCIIIHAMSSLPLPSYPWLFLFHYWTPLTSMMIHVMDPLSLTDFILLSCLLVIPFSFMNSFDINANYILQKYPPLALMATSKHSPPLTTMTKDNLLCYWGFHVFLLSDNSPYHHTSLEIVLPPLQFV